MNLRKFINDAKAAKQLLESEVGKEVIGKADLLKPYAKKFVTDKKFRDSVTSAANVARAIQKEAKASGNPADAVIKAVSDEKVREDVKNVVSHLRDVSKDVPKKPAKAAKPKPAAADGTTEAGETPEDSFWPESDNAPVMKLLVALALFALVLFVLRSRADD